MPMPPAVPGVPPTVLVLGGARSGKSAHAEALLAGMPAVYLATARRWDGDGEMAERIARHQARRGPLWRTHEEPLDLAGALAGASRPGRPVLVDCLTLWLTNLLLDDHDIDAATGRLLAALPGLPGPVVFVANEVGFGIVPDNALARAFRDQAGILNPRVAAACARVVLVAAGLPLILKDQQP